MHREYTIFLEKGLDGNWIAECPAFQSCRTQGKTKDEAYERIKKVIELCIEEFNEHYSLP